MRCSRTSHILTHENVYVPLRMHFIYLFRYRSQNCENPFNWSTYKFVDSFQLRMARAHTHTPAHRTKTTAQLHTAKMIIMHLLRCSWNTQIFVDICYKGPVHCMLSAILTKQNEQTKERKKKTLAFQYVIDHMSQDLRKENMIKSFVLCILHAVCIRQNQQKRITHRTVRVLYIGF